MTPHIKTLTDEIRRTESFLASSMGQSPNRQEVVNHLAKLKQNYQAISGYSWEQRKDIDVYVPSKDLGDKLI